MRKTIQLAIQQIRVGYMRLDVIVALCEDGTIWTLDRVYDTEKNNYRLHWQQVLSIPEDTEK